MDLVKLFTREEPIAGMEISDSYVRMALLALKKEKKKKKEIVEITALKEAPLKKGIIVDGVIKDKAAFVKTLKEIIKGVKPKIRYAVVSILPNNIYSHLYSFPKTVSGEKLEETMKLTIGFQLPVKIEEVYLDWEKIPSVEENEIFLAAVPKQIIDVYTEILTASGIMPVAMEFHSMSAVRLIDFSSDKAYLLLIADRQNINISIIKNKAVKFNRLVPVDFLNDDIRKTIDFYESETRDHISRILLIGDKKNLGDSISNMSISQAVINKIFHGYSEIKKDGNQWLIAMGAAIRGIMPRSEDTLVSLLPVGTEEAYENQKAIVFSQFLSNLALGLSVFFGAVFVGVWILMTILQQNFNTQLSALNILPLATDAVELENRAKKFNELITETSGLLGNLPKWSGVIEEIKLRAGPGITISNLSIPSPEGIINISGIGQSRIQLNLFKKNLEESPMFTEVTLPLTNLEMKKNIPFSISFRLKDLAILYVQ